MKKNLFYPAVHITEVMEKLGRDVSDTDNYPFLLCTLDSEIDQHYADRILSGAVDSVVHRRDFGLGHIRFEWNATGKYAPGIRFAVMSDNGPVVDENGFLGSPIWYDHADLVLPFLNFDFRGNTADALVAWGYYARTDLNGDKLHDGDENLTGNQKLCWRTGDGNVEIVHNFCQSTTSEAGHVLIAVPWGGAHSETRGQSEKILSMTNSFERGLEFFQSCSSDRGAKGYDFYIIDVEKAVKDRERDDFRLMLGRSFERTTTQQRSNCFMFQRKYIAFQARQKELAVFKKKVAEIDERINTRYKKEVKGSATAGRSCVVLPERMESVMSYVALPEQPTDYTCSLEKMNQARIPVEAWKKLEAAEDALNAKMDAWLDFAPLYADLADVVLQKCHGTAEVDLVCLKMTMPNTYVMDANVPGTGAYNTRKYDFSETHLEACVKYIQDFLDTSRAKRKKNLSAISELIGKIPEVTAE